MSIQWPNTHVQRHVLGALPPHHPPSASLKRAGKRYITAMTELNKQICDYNAEALQRQLNNCRSNVEMQQVLLQVVQVPFVAVNIHTLSAHVPRLLMLDRAAQCVSVLREVLDEWENDSAAVPDLSAQPTTGTSGEDAAPASFSVFSAWSPIQPTSLV